MDVRGEVVDEARQVQIELGVLDGDYVWLDADPEDRPYRGAETSDEYYDVARVMCAMGDPSFVNGRLYTQAGWVVVPLQFKTDPKQSGVTCISSL